jgi:hypothetical protein
LAACLLAILTVCAINPWVATIVLPDEALAQVKLPSAEELARTLGIEKVADKMRFFSHKNSPESS